VKITKVETMVIALPNRWAYGWHGLQIPIGRYVILRLETDTGLVGLGEAPTLPDWGGEHARYYGEDPETAIHMIQKYFTPILIGADPRDISKLMAQLDVPVRGHMCAKSAIDLALHDLAGKAAGVPVYQLLGGAMRKKIAICHSVGLAPPKEAANEATGLNPSRSRLMETQKPIVRSLPRSGMPWGMVRIFIRTSTKATEPPNKRLHPSRQ
jgi:muconate cycloisomerase